MNKRFNELKNNNITKQEIKYKGDRNRIKYIGKVLNEVPNGKVIMY